jgi:SAM-dependent methyltransferase
VRNTGFNGTHGAPRFVDRAIEAADVDAWPMPAAAAVDAAPQAQVFAFLADHTPRSSRFRELASRWTETILSSSIIPLRLRAAGASLRARLARRGNPALPQSQDLDVYWDPEMAEILEHWGTGNAWNEIQLLLANVRGKVIDIACGTGKVMSILASYPALELHGCDISDLMIAKAIERGIPRERLRVADATATPYGDGAFDYGYSIGSLEHFTEDGIAKFVAEARRITRVASFHQIPTARSGRNEGWLKRRQSYHNNSVEWWLRFFHGSYATVHVLDSAWNDKISVGKWFLCIAGGA